MSNKSNRESVRIKSIIVTDNDFDDILDIDKTYQVKYDEDNEPYIVDKRKCKCYDIFNFDDAYEVVS